MKLNISKEIKDCTECPFYDFHNHAQGGTIGYRFVCKETKANDFEPIIDGALSEPQLWRLQMRCPYIDWLPELKRVAKVNEGG